MAKSTIPKCHLTYADYASIGVVGGRGGARGEGGRAGRGGGARGGEGRGREGARREGRGRRDIYATIPPTSIRLVQIAKCPSLPIRPNAQTRRRLPIWRNGQASGVLAHLAKRTRTHTQADSTSMPLALRLATNAHARPRTPGRPPSGRQGAGQCLSRSFSRFRVDG